ncbi:MAG TPA: hypothetical protein VGG66_02845 [Rhizomicrobium sp.]|jgi:hypothetical protein
MSDRSPRFGAPLLLGGIFLPALAYAHGILGDRFFPATISSDDPFAADELALPTITHFNHETDYDFDWSKSIFPGFAISVGSGYRDDRPPNDTPSTGFSNLDVSPAFEFYRDSASETILTMGVDWEIGGTGSKAVAGSRSTYTPTFKYGQGFGGLPDSLWYLKPLAITGTLGYAIPDSAESKSVEWAGAVEYSLLYLQNNVRDQGFSNFAAHLAPVVEYSFSSAVQKGAGGTTGTINPGIIWSGQYTQVAVEAMIPANKASGDSVGVIAQFHFYMDDLFPRSLGTPIFGGRR